MTSAETINAFWFGDAARDDCTLEAFATRTKAWFFRDDALDREVSAKFADDVARAAKGELDAWKSTPAGRLALILLLDQFPRNIYRGKPAAFATDQPALDLALEGMANGVDRELSAGERLVFYLPLMHAEDLALQKRSVAAYQKLHDEGPEAVRPELAGALKAANAHLSIIERFGRFPHRNEALGRASTPEEAAFLGGPNSRF